jgi:hypothetical protein
VSSAEELRAEVARLKAAVVEIGAAHVAAQAEVERLRAALDMVAEEREAWKARALGMTPAPCRHNDHVHITDAWQT